MCRPMSVVVMALILVLSVSLHAPVTHAQTSESSSSSSTGGHLLESSSSSSINDSIIGASSSYGNNTGNASDSSTGSAFVPVPLPPTTAQKLANASCPYVNDDALQAATDMAENGWCSAGRVDGVHQCADTFNNCGGNDPNSQYYKVAQGIEQDSIYSTNPPNWWLCNYTSNTDTVIPGVNGTNATTVSVTTLTRMSVVSQSCFTDSSQCTPLRYMTRVNELVNGSVQWTGQQFPPYASGDRPPIAVVMAGAAFVNASLFYPAVDTLQLLQIQSSANQSFLSLSTSTRVVVEIPGGVISNSRTRIAKSSSGSGCGYVVPFFTLIVDLASGYPDSAEWQDDCSTCQSGAFVYSDDGACNCGVPPAACINYNATGTVNGTTDGYDNGSVDCDLKIYIAYSGTDRSGNVLTSSSRTLANFRKWSIGSLYNNIVSTYNNIPSISNSFGNTCKTRADPNDPNSDCLDWE